MSTLFNGLLSKKILITGASGFLGSHLSKQLSSYGIAVHAVSRSDKNIHHSLSDSITWWKCNLENIQEVRELFHTIKPDVVYHLSGLPTGRSELEFVLPTFQSLLISTVNLLTVVVEVGCQRLVIPGSLEEPNPGQNEFIPGSPYAAAKWASSNYSLMFHQLYKTPVVLLNLFMTYGPWQASSKVIPSIMLSLLEGRPPELASGKRLIDWIYVDDVIDAFIKAGYQPNIEGEKLDVGSGKLTSIREIAEYLANLINPSITPIFGAIPDRATEKTQLANTDHTYDKLFWKPTTSLNEGLERTVEWYKQKLRANERTMQLLNNRF